MIKQSLILVLFLLLFFIPTRPGIIWRTGSTVALVLGANWMHLRVERTEKIQEAVYAHVTGKSTKATLEDFPPVGLIESSRNFINEVRGYVPVEAITAGLKKIFDDKDGKENNLQDKLHELMDQTGVSKGKND